MPEYIFDEGRGVKHESAGEGRRRSGVRNRL